MRKLATIWAAAAFIAAGTMRTATTADADEAVILKCSEKIEVEDEFTGALDDVVLVSSTVPQVVFFGATFGPQNCNPNDGEDGGSQFFTAGDNCTACLTELSEEFDCKIVGVSESVGSSEEIPPTADDGRKEKTEVVLNKFVLMCDD